MSVNTSSTTRRHAIPWGALVLGAAVSAGIAVTANLLIRAIFLGAFTINDEFEPLASSGPIFLTTIIGTGLAALVFALVIRLRRRPMRDFQIIAVIVLALSALPLIGTWSSDDAASGAAIGALALMHVATATTVLFVFVPFVGRRMALSS